MCILRWLFIVVTYRTENGPRSTPDEWTRSGESHDYAQENLIANE